MASISQGLVLTTAMIVSSTVLYLAFSRQKTSPPLPISHGSNKQILRSCLCSEEKKRERKKKKKKVKFADNVKEAARETNKEVRERQSKQNRGEQGKRNRVSSKCRNETPEIRGMPANRIALYNGILRDRVHRMECCY